LVLFLEFDLDIGAAIVVQIVKNNTVYFDSLGKVDRSIAISRVARLCQRVDPLGIAFGGHKID